MQVKQAVLWWGNMWRASDKQHMRYEVMHVSSTAVQEPNEGFTGELPWAEAFVDFMFSLLNHNNKGEIQAAPPLHKHKQIYLEIHLQ
jgi:hypothetical protein